MRLQDSGVLAHQAHKAWRAQAASGVTLDQYLMYSYLRRAGTVTCRRVCVTDIIDVPVLLRHPDLTHNNTFLVAQDPLYHRHC